MLFFSGAVQAKPDSLIWLHWTPIKNRISITSVLSSSNETDVMQICGGSVFLLPVVIITIVNTNQQL